MERRFGRYVVVETLGSGAMGDVHRARDERLGREVAIKTVKNVAGLAADLFRSRFEAEARALAALSHPAIVGVHDLGVDGDEPYLVMELVDGPSLKAILAGGGLSPDEVRAMGIQLSRALEAAHRRQILHRDLKPANILRASNGQWKLADFGIARVPDSDLTITGQFLGTPAYAAPEAIILGQFSDRSDVFGLAMTMVEALTGARLRGPATLTELVARGDAELELPPTVPPDLARVLGPALAREPSRRPTAAAFAEQLAGATVPARALTPAPAEATAVLGPARAAPPIPAPLPLGPRAASAPAARRRLSLLLAGGAGLVAVGVIAALAAGGGEGSPAPAASPRDGLATSTPPPGRAPATPPGEPLDPDGADAVADAGPDLAATRELPPIVPGRVTVLYPQNLDRRGYEAYGKVVEKVRERKWDDALEELDAFERRFEETVETAHLRAQLDALLGPDEEEWDGPPGLRGRGRGDD